MDCDFQSDHGIDEWVEMMLSPLQGGRYPLSGTIELTERCNFTCQHCYINQPAGDRLVKFRELTTGQWKDIIDQFADAGCLFLLVTGGEPLLRPDFAEIFLHICSRGILTHLFSNGSLLTPEIADLLAENNLRSLEITLYGGTAETYEKVTGMKGSFERCLRGIELALERNITLALKAVLLTTNLHELDEMRALVKSFGLTSFRYDGNLWPRIDGNPAPLAYQISFEDLLSLDFDDAERYDKWVETYNQFEDQFKNVPARAGRVFSCGAAFRSFHIDAYGNLCPCGMVRCPSFSLKESDFRTAWEAVGDIRTWKKSMHTPCDTCTANNLCSQCPGRSFSTHADFETPDPFICELGKKRAQRVILQIQHESI